MADRDKTKSERREAAGHATKAERKEAKARRKQRSGSASPPLEAVTPAVEGASAVEGGSGDGIEQRLERLEQAVVAQSQLSEELLEKLDEVLEEARKSARHAKTAAAGPDPGAEAPESEAPGGDAPEGGAPSPPPAVP
jgi:hypothetical protein